MKNTNSNEPVLGFWNYSDEFLIGEYFPNGGCTAEFKLVKTVYGFQAQIYDDAFKLVLNPKLKKTLENDKEYQCYEGYGIISYKHRFSQV